MDHTSVSKVQRFTRVGPDQAAVNRQVNMEETCSVDMLVPEAFSCAVCLELMVCPMKCFPCRHSFCEPCVRLITHASDPLDTLCPIYRQAILCCGPNNVLKNQILNVDPLMAGAYERRLDRFRRQEGFREMRLPGIAGLGILPKLGAWLPGGNRLADYLVQTLFGLITGRGALDICKRLRTRYQQLFALAFSVVMCLLIPCIYLRTILQHPLPSSILSQANESANLDALFNTSDTSSNSSRNDDGNGTTPTLLPFKPYGTLSGFPFIVLCFICFLCITRVLACLRIPPECLPAEWASYSRCFLACCVAYYSWMIPIFVCFCIIIDDCMMRYLFYSFRYWKQENQEVAPLQFAVCSFALAGYWVAMLLATAACFKLDTSQHIGSWKCFKILTRAFFAYYLVLWLVLIALDSYYNFLYE